MNKIILFLSLVPFIASCQSDDVVNETFKDVTMTMTVTDSTWTYINMERGKIVGTSSVKDKDADASWHDRTDWDVAFSGDKIRTNGGTSGKGEGGVVVIGQAYEDVVEAPADGYIADSCNVEIW